MAREEIPLREVTTEEIWAEVQRLRGEIQTHNHLTFGSQELNGIVNGILQSPNFITGSSGWQLKPNGDLEANSGTFRGALVGNSLEIGTNGIHIDTNGNMWWGSSSTYAGASIKISSAGSVDFTTGNFSGTLVAAAGTLGVITAADIKTAASGARIHLGAGVTSIAIYTANEKKSSITGFDAELRVRMEEAGGYVTLYAQNDGDSAIEVLRIDGNDGVSMGGSLPFNAFNVVINKTGTGSTRPLDIANAGTGITALFSCTHATTTAQLLYLSMEGKGTALHLVLTNAANANRGINVTHAGLGEVAYFQSDSNVSRTAPVVSIAGFAGQGAHLRLNDMAGNPSTPTDGDIWFDGSDLKMRIGATTYKFDKTSV